MTQPLGEYDMVSYNADVLKYMLEDCISLCDEVLFQFELSHSQDAVARIIWESRRSYLERLLNAVKAGNAP